MRYSLEDIIREWKATDRSIDFHEYLIQWYTAVYDHALNHVGFRRSGDENFNRSVY